MVGEVGRMIDTETNVTEVTGVLNGVTVFRDRAQVSYVATTKLSCGRHTLRLEQDGAYEAWKSNTLQVRLEGHDPQLPIVLRDVTGRVNTTPSASSTRVAPAQEELKLAEAKLAAAQSAVDRSRKLLEMVDAIEQVQMKASTHPRHGEAGDAGDAGDAQRFLCDPGRWVEMADFLNTRRTEVSAKMREQLSDLAGAERAVEKHKSALSRYRELNSATVTRNYVDVHVDVLAATGAGMAAVRLLFTFNVFGAMWSPLYDLRVLSPTATMKEPELELTYCAEVVQTTGVDWVKVPVTLSTALPHVGAEPPSFPTPTWLISTTPHDLWNIRNVGRSECFELNGRCAMNESVPRQACAPAVEEAAVSSTRFLPAATIFAVPGDTTVRSDGEKVRLTLARRRFPVKLTYLATPCSDSGVYLTGKAKNTSPFQLLPGPSSIYFDNTFVNKSSLTHISAGEEFTVSLGCDEAVKVTRTDVGRRTNTGRDGLFSDKKTTLKYHFDFRLENTLAVGNAHVVLRDHFPITSDPEDLKVTLLSPDPDALKEYGTEFTEGAAVNPEDHTVEWHMTLKPKEKRGVSLKFHVKYRSEYTAYGV